MCIDRPPTLRLGITHDSLHYRGFQMTQIERLDPHALPIESGLTEAESLYASAARADNTIRGYKSDWREFSSWCEANKRLAMPADDATISQYLTALANHEASVGTMSRRLSAIRFAHKVKELPDPTQSARVITVWEGIRRVHGKPAKQAAPLMPPELFEVLDACPPDKLAGLRDKALILTGFVGALRRSEICALQANELAEHNKGAVMSLPRSKGNQTGEEVELVVLPRGNRPEHCPVTVLQHWMDAANISTGVVFRPVSRGDKSVERQLNPDSVNALVQRALTRAGIDPTPYSAHSLRAGFVTYAHLKGASDRAIARQTRHRSLATVGQYIRVQEAWTGNAAADLDFLFDD